MMSVKKEERNDAGGSDTLRMGVSHFGTPTREVIEGRVNAAFTTSQRFPDWNAEGAMTAVVPFFTCPGISSDTSFQTALTHLTTELADMLMHRDLLTREVQLTPFHYMNCRIFRATRSIVSWVMAARDIVSMEGPFGGSVSSYKSGVTENQTVPDGKRFPTSNILLIIVRTAFMVREDLTGVGRQSGEVPQCTTERDVVLNLTTELWRARSFGGAVPYDALRESLTTMVRHDRGLLDGLYEVGRKKSLG